MRVHWRLPISSPSSNSYVTNCGCVQQAFSLSSPWQQGISEPITPDIRWQKKKKPCISSPTKMQKENSRENKMRRGGINALGCCILRATFRSGNPSVYYWFCSRFKVACSFVCRGLLGNIGYSIHLKIVGKKCRKRQHTSSSSWFFGLPPFLSFPISLYVVRGIKGQVKKCVNVLLFLALQMVCFAKTSCYRCDMIPPVFPLWSKGFLDLAGRFCTRKLRDPASCWMVLIAGKSYPKTGAVRTLGWGRIFFCQYLRIPVFWYSYGTFYLFTRKKHFGCS